MELAKEVYSVSKQVTTVYIGRKPIMNYVLAVIIGFKACMHVFEQRRSLMKSKIQSNVRAQLLGRT